MWDSSLFLHLAYLGKSTDSATLRHLQLLAGLSIEDAAALWPCVYQRRLQDLQPSRFAALLTISNSATTAGAVLPEAESASGSWRIGGVVR